MVRHISASNAANIQTALDAADDEIVLGAGNFAIPDTLVQPFKISQVMRGVGAGNYTNPNHNHRGATTVLEWIPGTQIRPLLKLQGSYFALRDLMLMGPETGIHIVKPRPGIGSGKHRFDNIVVEGADIAWQIAEDAGSQNCDVCSWRDITVIQTDTAFKSLGHQAMQMQISALHCRRVNTVLDIRGGGCWYADGVGVMKPKDDDIRPTLLRIEQTRFDGRAAIGSNNGYFEIRNVKTDNQAGSIRLLDQVNDCPVDVHLSGGQLVYPPDAILRSNGALTVTGYRYLGSLFLTWHDKPRKRTPHFTLRDSWVKGDAVGSPRDLFNLADSSGKCWMTIENNYCYPSGEPLADFHGPMDAGDVVINNGDDDD